MSWNLNLCKKKHYDTLKKIAYKRYKWAVGLYEKKYF